jgi:RNAse (barnase) inhibitor barstar
MIRQDHIFIRHVQTGSDMFRHVQTCSDLFSDLKNIYGFSKYILDFLNIFWDFLNIVLLTDVVLTRLKYVYLVLTRE